MSRLIAFTMTRAVMPHNVLFPELVQFALSPADRRYARNCRALRSVFQ
jgi:hypothetical protein